MSKKTIEYAKKLVSQMTIDEKISQMLYESPAIERLGIPEYNWWNEALHGVARAGVATVFPQAIGLAATFDTDLIEKIGDVVSELGNALNGIPTETMQSDLNAFKQKYASSDEKLTSATNYLNSEVGDCNNKINELNIEIANLQRQYEAEKAAEEAARRAAEEAARKAAEEAAQKLTNLLRR